MTDNISAVEEVQVDPEGVKRLLKSIVKLETSNDKSKQLSDSDMVRRITKMIEEEADCYSNQLR